MKVVFDVQYFRVDYWGDEIKGHETCMWEIRIA
jgi:hypothetical protein